MTSRARLALSILVPALVGLNHDVRPARAELMTSPAWTFPRGSSVGTAGDVNGDGFSDVIVGTSERGLVFHGSATGLASDPAWSVMVGASSVGTAGDLNGDGFSDVIIGAANHSNGEDGEGRAYVYLGSATGLSIFPTWIGESNQENAHFGTSVGTAGDVNGDGYSDVVVAAPGYDNGGVAGRALAYHGAADEPIGVGEPSASPADLRLEASAPNPFANTTQIAYTLPGRGPARLAVYDVAGREVVVLADRVQEPGRHTAAWDGRDARGVPVPAGIYFTRLEFAGKVDALKIVLAP